MNIADFLAPEDVVIGLPARSKKQFLEDIAGHAAQVVGLDAEDVFDLLIEREKLGSTGVGSGIAIPHGKHPNMPVLRGFFWRAATPIDFEAIDNEPVDLVFLLLAPETAGADHLKALACVSRALRSPETCTALREAVDAQKIYTILNGQATD